MLISVDVDRDALIEDIVMELQDDESILKFIEALDLQFADWEVTELMYNYFAKQMESLKRRINERFFSRITKVDGGI